MNRKAYSFLSVHSLFRYYRTLQYLRWQQLFYRGYYPIKRIWLRLRGAEAKHIQKATAFPSINFISLNLYDSCYNFDNQEFIFINRAVSFPNNINWEYQEEGLLWLFHLHYFNYLYNEDLSNEQALNTIGQFVDNQKFTGIFSHAYPASLRIKNWIRFFVSRGLVPERYILESLYKQAEHLSHFPEYEIMANHLLQNGIALVWAGLYFGDERILTIGKKICREELDEQLLEDGCHFEKSIAYHSHILKDLLELAHFISNQEVEVGFLKILIDKSYKMVLFYDLFVNAQSHAPHFGDSNEAFLIGPDCIHRLQTYLPPRDLPPVKPSDSGYRIMENGHLKLYFNSGLIPAAYQPGHTHADAFSFCLFAKGQPLIVDSGLSTYTEGERRTWERSSAAHNVVSVKGEDSIELWKAFRVGRRIEINCLVESTKKIEYQHLGFYKKYGIALKRSLSWQGDELWLEDEALAASLKEELCYYLHFHPSCNVIMKENICIVDNYGIIIELYNLRLELEEYDYALDFGKTQKSKRIKASFVEGCTKSQTKIKCMYE